MSATVVELYFLPQYTVTKWRNEQYQHHRAALEQGTEAAPRCECVSLKCDAGCHSQTADVPLHSV